MSRGHNQHQSAEEKAKRVATRRERRALLGPQAQRRRTDIDTSGYAGDADYCMATFYRKRPRLSDEQREE